MAKCFCLPITETHGISHTVTGQGWDNKYVLDAFSSVVASDVPDRYFIMTNKWKQSSLSLHMFFRSTSTVYHTHPPMLIQHSARRIVNSLSNLQPIGRAFALVQPASDRTALTSEPVKSTEEQVEVIKVGVAHCLFVFFEDINGLCFTSRWCLTSPSLLPFQVYLEARKQEQQTHQQSLKMLSDEVSQIQEVSIHTRYLL